MKMHDHRNQINRLHDLIKRKATGSLDALADKFGVGRSTMSRYIDDFKQEFDPPIAYDRNVHSYYYTEPFEVRVWVEVNRDGERKQF
jgi:predicted DNA-binding transcriptional regulator YafY